MTKPKLPDTGLAFSLGEVAQELQQGAAYDREGQVARTLVRTDDLRIVLVVLKAGKTISEHRAGVTASVQTLSGHIRLQLPDRSVELPAGELLVLGAGLEHDVQAETDSTFLLTLGWPSKG